MGIDIRDHGGSFGGGNAKAAIHVDSTVFRAQVAIESSVTSGANYYGQKYLGDGIFMHFQTWSGAQYTVNFINDKNEIVSTIQQFQLPTNITSSYPISKTCKLPDGRYVFSFYGNIYTVSADLSTITLVKFNGSYGSNSGNSVIALFMSTQGKLIAFNMSGNFYILNPSTFVQEGMPPVTNYSLWANGAGQIYEDDNVLIIKDGNTTGDFIKISKSVTVSVTPILFKGNSAARNAIVGDGTYYYITNGNYIEKRLISTMALVSQHTPSNLPTGIFWDSLKKRPIIQSSTTGKVQAFNPATNLFDTAYQANNLTTSVPELGAEDPDNYRVLLAGKVYNYGIKRL